MKIYFYLSLSSFCAALGQVFLKRGANIIPSIYLGIGMALYAVGFLLWIYCLSKTSLTIVYSFTLLTFILVFFMANIFFNEKISILSLAGISLVVLGFILITKGQSVL